MILWISCAANSWKKQYFSGWQTLWLCNDFLSPQGDSNNHPSMHDLYLRLLHLGSQGLLILPSCGRRRSYTQNNSPHQFIAGQKTNNPSHSYSQFGLPSLHVHVFRLWEEVGEPTQTQGEHANSAQKDPGPQGSKPRPSCCETTVLTTAPTKHPPIHSPVMLISVSEPSQLSWRFSWQVTWLHCIPTMLFWFW